MVDKNNSIFHCPTCRGPIEGLNGLRCLLDTTYVGYYLLSKQNGRNISFLQPREDHQLQAIVNQVVPGLEVEEGQRRKKFYEEHCEEETDQNV